MKADKDAEKNLAETYYEHLLQRPLTTRSFCVALKPSGSVTFGTVT